MKKRIAVCLCVVSMLLLAGVVYAANPIKIFVNGKQVVSDVSPSIQGGRTMVPLRVISEALNADVKWEGETQSVYITQPVPPNFDDLLYMENAQWILTEMEAAIDIFDGLYESINKMHDSPYRSDWISIIEEGISNLNAYNNNFKVQVPDTVNYLLATAPEFKGFTDGLQGEHKQFVSLLDKYTALAQSLKTSDSEYFYDKNYEHYNDYLLLKANINKSSLYLHNTTLGYINYVKNKN